MNSSFIFRIRVLSVLILIFALVMIGQLFKVGVIHGNLYSEKANRQYATPSENIFERGTIYFQRKSGDLVSGATLMSGYKIAISPKDIKDAEKAYESLSVFLKLDKQDFLNRANKKSDVYEEIANRQTEEIANSISELKIPGVNIYKEKWRFYPGNNLASNTIGFVGWRGDELAGRYGLERSYNKTLSLANNDLYVNFFAEVFSNISKAINKEEKRGDIVTTIEPTVENYLEKRLSIITETYSPDAVGGIIMNPKTGEIYAMAQKPDFNVNDFSTVKNTKTFANMNVENVFEMGSIIKPLVMAGALDAKVITPETTYNDTGSVIVDGKELHNFDLKGRGKVDMQEVLSQSLNTGMVYIYKKLGREKFRNYLLSYGLGEKTGIDLPNETSGLVSNLNSPRDLEYATASFGQGIAVTPVEAIRSFAVLGNGGILVTPHLVKEIHYSEGGNKILEWPQKQAGISKEATETITSMLVANIDKGYSNGANRMERYSVAAKTGTAQVARDDGKGYYDDKRLHSFFGYFPAYDPQFVVLFYAIDPKGVQYASQSLLPHFMSTARFLLNYYDVPPDR